MRGSRAYAEVGELYAACYPRIVGVVALAAGSRAEAEECVQEAFIRLLGAWDKVAWYNNPEAWVRAVAFNLLSNSRRKTRNGVLALVRLGRARDEAPSADEPTDVAWALRQLPLPQRQTVVLHYLVGLNVDEVARTLDIAPGTVKSRLSRARDALAPLLREEAPHA